MRIGVLSDIHDNIWALERALSRVQDCEMLLVLGDICSAFCLAMVVEGFAGPVHVVWGNNDADRLHLGQQAARGDVTLHGEFGELVCDDRRIAMTHYPELGRALAAGGTYDLVCHGHNHQRSVQQVGFTLLVNPGEVMGRFGVSSIAVYDTAQGTAEIIEV